MSMTHFTLAQTLGLSTLLLATTACSREAMAQTKADSKPSTPPAVTAANDVGAGALLDKARAAIKDVRTFSATAYVEDIAQPGVTTTADIFARRIDGGGWQLGAKGTSQDAAGKETHRFNLGYDGLTARSIRVDEKTVDDRSLEKPNDVRVFFSVQGASHPMPWEILDDQTPLGEGAIAAFLPPTTVAGELCDVLELTPSVDTKMAGSGRVRVAIAKKDNLPRRIERVRLDKDGKVIFGRALELRGLKVNKDALMGPFTLDVPDGYRVRTKDTSAMRAKASEDDAGEKPAENATPDASDWPHSPRLLGQGSPAPAFVLKDAEGVERTLASYKGKVVVMDFWATWCPPCRMAMPALQRLHVKYKDQPVVILGMNAEGGGDGDPVKFKKDNGYTYPLILKADAISDRYRVQGLPTFYVFSPESKVVWGAVGLAAPKDVQQPTPDDYAKFLEATLTKHIDSELAKLNAKGTGSSRAKTLAQWPHDERLVAVGSPAPAFTLKDTKGKTHSLSDYKGKVVVLDFWATWCPPCRVALPAIDKLHTKYKDNDKVVILGMNAQRGRPGNAGEFLRDKGFDFTTLLDAEELRGPYQSPGIPTFYVIDPEGKIVWGGVGLAGPAGAKTKPSDDDYRMVLLDVLSAHIDAQLEKMK